MTPTFAANGREALAASPQCPPDLVLTDLQMPEMDGLALVETVRRTFPVLPVILMTAHGSEEIAVQALRRGAAGYVAKRNLAAELVKTVLSVLEIARADRSQKHILGCLTQTESRYELDNDIKQHPAADRPAGGQPDAHAAVRRDRAHSRRASPCARRWSTPSTTATWSPTSDAARRTTRTSSPAGGAAARTRIRTRGGACTVMARETRDEVTYVIRDEGQGFDPSSLPDPTAAAEPGAPARGRGLFLIRTFMDEVRYNAVGNEITMVKRRDAAAPGGGPLAVAAAVAALSSQATK